MATIKTRINVTLSDDVREALGKLAEREHIPQATKAARLLESALEIEEDQLWDQLAQKRKQAQAHFISHAKAWE